MYVRVGGSAVQDGFGPGGDDEQERLDAGARLSAPGLPWRGPLGGGIAGVRERVRAARALLDRPLTSYYLIIGITTLLLCLGLMMVLSTGSVIDLTKGESPYHDFEWQLVGIVVGLPIMWLMARSSPRVFRAMAYPLLAVSIIGLGLTLIPGVARSAERRLSLDRARARSPSSRRSWPSWRSRSGARTCSPARRSWGCWPTGGTCWSRWCRARACSPCW